MTTLLNLLNASIECNNVGVVLLNAGDVDNALDSFMTAAKLMHPVSKQVQSIPPAMDNNTCQESSAPACPEPGFEIPDGIRRVVQQSQDLINVKGKQPTDNIFIRADPLRLDLAHRLPADCTLESAVVVLNMALAYHLRGSTPCLNRAVFLYGMAFNLSHALVTDQRAGRVAMSSLNNAGQIYHHMGEYTISRKYLDTLRVYILKLPLAVDTRTMEERHQFLLNAVLLRAPTMASAA